MGVDPAHSTWAVTVSLIAVAMVAPLAGAASDRLGRKRLIVGAAFLVVVPTLLVAASPSWPILLVWRFLQGALLPFIFAVTVAYIGEESEDPPTAIRTTGVYASGTILGGFSGRFLAGIAAEAAGWRAAFVTLAAVNVCAAALVAWLLPAERRFSRLSGGLRASLADYAGHLGNGRLLGTCAVGFGMLFSLVAAFTFVNLHLAAPPFGLGPSALGSVFAIYLLGAVAAPLASRAAARIGRRATVAAATAAGLAGMALTLLPSIAAIVAGLAATSVALFVTQALALSIIPQSVSRARSAAVGLYVCAYYVGGAAGGAVPIPLWHHAGWPGVVGLVTAVMSAMLFAALRVWRFPT